MIEMDICESFKMSDNPYESLINDFANRGFDLESSDRESMLDLKNQFIEVAMGPDGTAALNRAFTTDMVSSRDNFRVPAFRGDKMSAAILADYAIKTGYPFEVRQLTELNNTVGGKIGQVKMFEHLNLPQYVNMGVDVNPRELKYHFQSTVIEALLDAIYVIAESIASGLGYVVANSYLTSYYNELEDQDSEKLLSSWIQQLEDNIGKTYTVGDEKINHFKLVTKVEPGGMYHSTLTLTSQSAEVINEYIRSNPILEFENRQGLSRYTTEARSLEKKDARDEVYRSMVQQFNRLGYNFSWRLLYRRVRELNNRYGKGYNDNRRLYKNLIDSGMYPYVKYIREYSSYKKSIIETSYLAQPYDPNVELHLQWTYKYDVIDNPVNTTPMEVNEYKDMVERDSNSSINQFYVKFYNDNRQLVTDRIKLESQRLNRFGVKLREGRE